MEKEKIEVDGSGVNVENLLRSIYKFPSGVSSQQRLVIRSSQLHDLALELEQAINNDTPREFLCVYSWAVDYIALEIKVITDRLMIQGKLDKKNGV